MFHYIFTVFDSFLYVSYVLAYCLPVIVFLVLLKNKLNSSSEVYHDWYHALKFWWAKNTVKKLQQKCARILKKESEEEMELPKKLTSFKKTDTQIIYGTDENGNMLYLKLIMRENRLVEAILQLRLSNGSMYQLPEHPAVLICSIPERKWCTNDLEISIVEPFHTFRITYSGLMRDRFSKNGDDTVGISFSFIWSAASRPTYYPYESAVDELANAVANENWKDGQWISLLQSEFGYDQYGMLIGQVQRTDLSEPSLTTVKMTSARKRYWGTSHTEALRHNVQLFGVDDQGLSFVIGVKSFKRRCRQLRYGTVILPNRKVYNITTDSDLSVSDIVKNEIFPGVIPFNFKANGVNYKCRAFTYMHSSSDIVNNEIRGWRCKLIKISIIINDHQAMGYITYWKDHKGKGLQLPKFLKTPYKHILYPEKKYVASLYENECRCISLSGQLGTHLALLKTVENKEFLVPNTMCILTTAFKHQLENSQRLKEALDDMCNVSYKRVEGSLSKACQKVTSVLLNETLHEDIASNVKEEFKTLLSNNLEDNSQTYWIIKLSSVEENTIPFVPPRKRETPLYCKSVEDIIDKIPICWAEAFKSENVKIRRQNGEEILTNIAVLVQQVIPSNICGVMTTINPDTGYTGEIIIKANYGIDMEASDPDIITVKKDIQNKVTIHSQIVGEKKHFYTVTDKEMYLCKLDDSVKNCICIKNEQSLKLSKVAMELSKTFGEPRYVEWALYKDHIYLNAGWPITRNAWSSFDLTHEMDAAIMSKKENISFNRVGRILSGAVSVLSQSLYLKGFDEGLQETSNDELNIFNIYVKKILTSVCHHVGLNEYQIYLEWIKKMEDYYIIQDYSDISENLLEDIDAKEKYMKPNQFSQFCKKLQYYWAYNSCAKEAKAISNALFIKHRDNSLGCYKEIDKQITKLIRIGQLYFKTAPFKARELPGDQISDNSTEDIIITSTIRSTSIEIFNKFRAIQYILSKKGLTKQFCKVNATEGFEWLKSNCPQVAINVRIFISELGHRGVKETDLLSKTWDMDNTTVIKALQLFIHKFENEDSIPNFKSRWNFSWILDLVGLSFINTTPYDVIRSALARSIHKMRIAYLNLGQKLVAEGLLPNVELIFHLTHYEIGKLISNRNPFLVKKAIRRSQLYPIWEKLQISTISCETVLANEIMKCENEITSRHTGISIVSGHVTGRACVINSVEDFENLLEGDIVITKFTDIGWSLFLPSLSGIVIEHSDFYAEGPILASLYQIPCIIGVNAATKYFKTGEKISLKADNYDITYQNGTIVKVEEKETRE